MKEAMMINRIDAVEDLDRILNVANILILNNDIYYNEKYIVIKYFWISIESHFRSEAPYFLLNDFHKYIIRKGLGYEMKAKRKYVNNENVWVYYRAYK